MEKGTIIANRFRVLDTLGQGGMGVVFRVIDTQNDITVALKLFESVLSPQSRLANPARQELARMFKREYEILSELRHPNIVRAIEFFETAETCLYTMESLGSDTTCAMSLADWIRSAEGQHSKLLTKLDMLLQLAHALKHVHERGFIHHDIKPDNVLVVSGEGALRVFLADFGIGLSRDNQTRAEIKMGTPHYQSPEDSYAQTIDARSDIYTFGVLAYELFSGEKPFDVRSGPGTSVRFAVRAMHMLREVGTLRGLPSSINTMIQICMRKEPADRYQGLQEIIERIEDSIAESRED